MSAALFPTKLNVTTLILLSFLLTAASAAVVNSNEDATVATTLSSTVSIARVDSTDADFTIGDDVVPVVTSRSHHTLVERGGPGHRMRRDLADEEVAQDGYFRRRRRRQTDTFRDEDERGKTAPFAGVKTRRSLNIFGNDGSDTVCPTVAMLYSVADRRFVHVGMDGSVKTIDRPESIHGIMLISLFLDRIIGELYRLTTVCCYSINYRPKSHEVSRKA